MWPWVERNVAEVRLRLPQKQDIDPLFYACGVMLVCCVIFGGVGARSGYLGDLILSLLAIPLLAMGLWRLFEVDLTRQMRGALWFCLALIALPLLQLVPLPPWLWTALPHREISAESFALIRQDAPWMPLSVSPDATWLSALSLLPPLSLFIGLLLLGYRERRWLSVVVFSIGVISAFLGLLQVAQGPGSALRFYQFKNQSEAIGFFWNRNHFAALLYVIILLGSAWAINAGAAVASALRRREFDASSALIALGCFTLLVVLIAAEAMARSRAGMGLTMVALVGAFFLGVADPGTRVGVSTPRKLLLVAIAVALVLTLQFALYRILQRFDQDEDVGPGSRAALTSDTIQAARAYMPVGSGVGSFTPVYRLFQPPEHILPNIYANTAVNDVAQTWMETGVFGLALIGWFVVWFVRRSLEIWRGVPPPDVDAIDWSLARAATIIIALLAVHAVFDFAARTAAIQALAAFACALMIEPPPSLLRQRTRKGVRQATKHRLKVAAPPVLAAPVAVTSPNAVALRPPPTSSPPAPRGRWGTDIQWPEEWRPSEGETPKAPRDPGKA